MDVLLVYSFNRSTVLATDPTKKLTGLPHVRLKYWTDKSGNGHHTHILITIYKACFVVCHSTTMLCTRVLYSKAYN